MAAKPTRTTMGTEEVEVPAGKYQAVRVKSKALMEWFAPSVECVKTVGRSKTGEIATVLKVFVPGK